jgi:GNAT superfamily N-acetyltransferase
MELVVAEGHRLEEILDATYPIWNEGLTRVAYGQWNGAQMQTPWGDAHLRRFALVDDRGRWVASAKRYRLPVRIGDADGWMCGLGAVFTRPDERGRGHGTAIVERLVERSRQEGAALAGLFSEIGERFYERCGFATVPMDEVTVRATAKAGAPAMLVRSGEERDLPALAAMHDTRSRGVRFALRRDAPLIHYALAKKRLLAGLGRPGVRHTEFFIAEEGASAVAYVVFTASRGGWTLEEAGDRDPAGARLGAILQVLLAREPSQPLPLIRAWWPPAFSVPPQVQLVDRVPARDIFMLRPLADLTSPALAEEVFYWRSDYF